METNAHTLNNGTMGNGCCCRVHLFKSVDARRGMDDTRHHIKDLHHGVLNHAHKLQKRGHDAEGNGAVAQAETAPHEGQEIA